MYLPDRFRVEDVARLHDFMRRYSFAVIITNAGGETMLSHAPTVLDVSRGTHGVLRAHLASTNPQVTHIGAGAEAVVLFQGPHGYVSPSWYTGPLEVPTWNYTAVYATGIARSLPDANDTLDLLEQLALQNEGPEGWRFDRNAQWIQVMLRQITAFEIPIARLNGKFKLSQNKGPRDRRAVIDVFSHSDDPAQRDLAQFMEEMNPD